ncbi:MAG TPA: hypothetical protein ENH62_06755 [Marinobacter sp.]|uniref:Uncharacterized protein n=1 Tax=marine sediment metagenome TaxID=412755 RepID=A0A0F9STW5_9ZZZZ|nr:hypothetical protein [Marinobacter sp.]
MSLHNSFPTKPTSGISPLSSATGSANSLPDFEEIKKMLMGSQQQFLDTQGGIIDTQANKAVEQGVSNIIGSGLSGTSVAGGLTAGIQNQATQAKTGLASSTQLDTNRLLLQYMGLLQGASDRSADRTLRADQSQRSGGGGSRAGSGGGGGIGGSVFGPFKFDLQGMEGTLRGQGGNQFAMAGAGLKEGIGAGLKEGANQTLPPQKLDYATRKRNPFYYVDVHGKVKTRPRRAVEPLDRGTKQQAEAHVAASGR